MQAELLTPALSHHLPQKYTLLVKDCYVILICMRLIWFIFGDMAHWMNELNPSWLKQPCNLHGAKHRNIELSRGIEQCCYSIALICFVWLANPTFATSCCLLNYSATMITATDLSKKRNVCVGYRRSATKIISMPIHCLSPIIPKLTNYRGWNMGSQSWLKYWTLWAVKLWRWHMQMK